MESMTWMPEWYTGQSGNPSRWAHMPGMESEEFSMESEEFSMESEEFRIDPAGGLPVGFWLVLPLPMSLLYYEKTRSN